MAIAEENITSDIYETAKLSIRYTKVKAGMPSDAAESLMKQCKAPTLVMAAEKDCLFPAKGVLTRSKKIMEEAVNPGFIIFPCVIYKLYNKTGG